MAPWTVAHQVPLFMGFHRQEYWSILAISFSSGSSRPRGRTRHLLLGRWILHHWATREAHRLYRSPLDSLQILGDFPENFALWISNLISLWPNNILFMMWITLNFLMVQHMIPHGLCYWEGCVLDGVLYKCHLDPDSWECHSNLLPSSWSSTCSISCWDGDIEISKCNRRCVCFSCNSISFFSVFEVLLLGE